MSAKAVCDVCKIEEVIESTPLGIAMMPQKWFVTVRPSDDGLKVSDVCSQVCAEAFDKSAGRTETIIHDLQNDEPVIRTLEHKAEN